LDTYHLDSLYLREQECEDPWLFFETKMGTRAKNFGKHWLKAWPSELNMAQDHACYCGLFRGPREGK
jgi:hypothetical protein